MSGDRAEGAGMAMIEITLLGNFTVVVDGAPVAETAWARRHAAALVKVLAMAPSWAVWRTTKSCLTATGS